MAIFLHCLSSGLPSFDKCPEKRSKKTWALPARCVQPRQGQAVWKSRADAPEIAGELLLATSVDGRTFTQFTKTPLPILVAQTTTNAWQIEFVVENRKFAGRGSPPARLAWLHLAGCLSRVNPPKGWTFTKGDDGTWRLENKKTGEMLEGYLTR
jgi:hypothetical protein